VTREGKFEQGDMKNKKAWPKKPARLSSMSNDIDRGDARYLLLLRLDERFSPCWLLRWPLPRDALPRSDCELLLRLLLPRLLPLPLPLDALLRLLRPEEDDDFELPDFMVTAPLDLSAAHVHTCNHNVTLGVLFEVCVGRVCACM
jgi:hypothetical protein